MATNARRGRPTVGTVLVVIGVLHLALTPFTYGQAWAEIGRAGVVDGIRTDASEAALWYVGAGLGVLILGIVARWAQRRTGTVPWGLGWLLLALAVFGIVLIPTSGFWLFVPTAGYALWTAKHPRSPEVSA